MHDGVVDDISQKKMARGEEDCEVTLEELSAYALPTVLLHLPLRTFAAAC